MRRYDDYGFNDLNFLQVKKLKDLYEVRLIVEPEMTTIAARKATDEDLQKIIKYTKLIEASPEEGDFTADMNKSSTTQLHWQLIMNLLSDCMRTSVRPR